MWQQTEIVLRAKPRGCHLVTSEIIESLTDLPSVNVGLLHVFILHTSASLTINENADPDVRTDLETVLNRIVPESQPLVHTIEGPDDMPAHVKASLLGASLTIPIRNGQLLLGTWQGIYLCEHRNHGGNRRLILTLWGSSNDAWWTT